MKISFNWLKTYISLNDSPEVVAQWLTDCGLEVESLEKTETIKGGLNGVVIGEVISCSPHPDADRLTLTTVNLGNEVVPIVCGAPNVAQGQKVVVATVGTTLYAANGDSFQIRKAKIRGQESMGMICAEDELGLGDSHDGIMVLPPDAVPGTPAREYFNIEDDWCIEIGLTPNRIDAASHMGVARDLAAVINHLEPHRNIALNRPSLDAFRVASNATPVEIRIEDPSACPRYAGLCISGIKVQESPDWLKNRLLVIGLKPINNIVDITNFVLHETGQPLHAFDLAKVKGNTVVVRKPAEGTTFITLDEEEIKLTGNDLMICNEADPMCMAGILGGIESGVSEETTSIFLESAYFDAATIRKSSKHHAINTDASFRFERGADPQMTLYALKRAAILICEIAGGQVMSEVLDVYPEPVQPQKLKFRYSAADKLIGKVIDRDTIKKILVGLEISILEEHEDSLLLEIPPFKVDVTREADVVEEILRIYGYNNVELPQHLHSSIVSSPRPDKERIQNIASDFLSSRGFAEIMNNSLTRASYYENDLFKPESVVKILNPLSQDLGVMRQTLFFGGLETLAWNQNRRVHDAKIYEFGNVYFREPATGNHRADKLDGYREQRMLALFMSGDLQPETWYAKQKAASLFDLKAEVINLLRKVNVATENATMEEIRSEGFFDTALRYSIGGKILFEAGEVGRGFLKAFDLKQDVFFASVNWELVLELIDKKPVVYREISKFPEVRRDLALLLPGNTRFEEIRKLAFDAERKLLKNVRLFDIYQDEKMGKELKSYAVSFTLQDEGKTLTDKEIDKAMERISRSILSALGATIR
ncbi:MAG: phenylalanine--tRNA ligase subunit beta [Bacteroidales bacterium]